MKNKWLLGLFAVLPMSAGWLLTPGRVQNQTARLPTLTNEERARLVAIGNKLFVDRCAKCHNEHGDKPLSTGPPLNERELSDEEIARSVSGRLKDSPQEDKRAVALYVSSFMKKK